MQYLGQQILENIYLYFFYSFSKKGTYTQLFLVFHFCLFKFVHRPYFI